MNTLQHLDKILRRHHAKLIIDPNHNDLVLSVPPRFDAHGNIECYATDYRLGQQFPQPTPQPSEPVELETAA